MAEHPVRHRCILVDLISNSLRYRKMPAMLYPRCNEKLLDALLSLSEIIRLVGYSEHVPYGLLNPGHGRATCDPGTAACGKHSASVLSMLALLFDYANCIKKRRAPSS
jgi:hypothetical protein